MLHKSIERERPLERYVETASRLLWPWSGLKLVSVVVLLAALDYTSTYAVLELSGNKYIYETSPIASWALQVGGFRTLFLVDLAIIAALLLTAAGARYLFSRWGFTGFGRTAFVILLVPYVIATMAAVFNNIALTFL